MGGPRAPLAGRWLHPCSVFLDMQHVKSSLPPCRVKPPREVKPEKAQPVVPRGQGVALHMSDGERALSVARVRRHRAGRPLHGHSRDMWMSVKSRLVLCDKYTRQPLDTTALCLVTPPRGAGGCQVSYRVSKALVAGVGVGAPRWSPRRTAVNGMLPLVLACAVCGCAGDAPPAPPAARVGGRLCCRL